MTTYTFDVTVNVKLQEIDVAYILSNAIEHCLRTWCYGIEVADNANDPDVISDIIKCKPLWFYSTEHTAHRLTLNSFLDGFKQWVEDGRDIFGIVQGNGSVIPDLMDDNVGCDEILQYALFGRLKFGTEGRPV